MSYVRFTHSFKGFADAWDLFHRIDEGHRKNCRILMSSCEAFMDELCWISFLDDLFTIHLINCDDIGRLFGVTSE